jgi:hypothetical protein
MDQMQRKHPPLDEPGYGEFISYYYKKKSVKVAKKRRKKQ